MKTVKLAMLIPLIGLLLGCESIHTTVAEDKSIDHGFDRKHLSQLKAGIWIDPNGCDHWIIDDGVEGYLSQRLDRKGKPVCSGIAPPTSVVGDFKSGGSGLIGDPY